MWLFRIDLLCFITDSLSCRLKGRIADMLTCWRRGMTKDKREDVVFVLSYCVWVQGYCRNPRAGICTSSVDEELFPEPPVDTGVTDSWVKFQFGLNCGLKENEHFYGAESTMAWSKAEWLWSKFNPDPTGPHACTMRVFWPGFHVKAVANLEAVIESRHRKSRFGILLQ